MYLKALKVHFTPLQGLKMPVFSMDLSHIRVI